MNLDAAMLIDAGGPGSGCRGDHCGRKPGLSERAQRALVSYVPMSAAKMEVAIKQQLRIAVAVRGVMTTDNHPFDVLTGKSGVEVKTNIEGKHGRITMHPKSRRRKIKAARQLGVKAHTVAVDVRGSDPVFYYAKGVGSYNYTAMRKVSLDELRNFIK